MTLSTIANSRRRLAGELASWISIALSLLVSPAAAEPPQATRRDATMAEALFREGRKLMNERRFSEACPKLEESQRLDPGGGTLLNLGICHAHMGKTATAWGELQEALGAARRDGRADREDIAKKQLAEVEPKLSRLTVEVPAETRVAGLALKLDGSTLSPAAWGSALPIDPGDHEVEATAPRRQRFTARVTVKPEHDSARVTVPGLTELRASADRPGAPGQEPAAPGESASRIGLRTASFLLGGAGLIGLGFGSGFGVDAILKERKARQTCPNPGPCPDEDALAASSAGATSAKNSNIAFAAGGAVLSVGVVLFVLSRSIGKPAPSTARWIPLAGSTGGGALWSGAF